MHIVMLALGTRGDVQPAIALGQGLQAAGHEVTLLAGENFAAWLRAHGLSFAPTLDMETLMKSPEGIAWVEEPNPLRQLQHMKLLLDANADKLYSSVAEPARGADLLISGFVSQPFAQAAAEKLGIPHVQALLQPFRRTASGAASLTPVTKGTSILNRWLGALAEQMIWQVSGTTTNAFRAQLGLPAHSTGSYLRALGKTPSVYGFSRHVVPQPPDWGDNQQITGYWFLDEGQNYQPPADLARFLAAGTPPVYVGFGSMSSGRPQETLDLIAEALRRSGQRGIIGSGWSGAEASNLPENMLLVEHAPHEWLFERVAAVVHHGGAGTTGAGLRAGKPTLIVPHFSDQPFWGRRVHELGVGAKPIPRHKLTAENLADGIRAVVSDRDLPEAAAALGAKIRAERGVENAVKWIEKMANVMGRRPRA